MNKDNFIAPTGGNEWDRAKNYIRVTRRTVEATVIGYGVAVSTIFPPAIIPTVGIGGLMVLGEGIIEATRRHPVRRAASAIHLQSPVEIRFQSPVRFGKDK